MKELDKLFINSLANYFREDSKLTINDKIYDIQEIVKKVGYKYHEDYFRNDFSALCLSNCPCEYLIIFNEDHNHNENFKRFSIAHELGHLTIPHHRSYLDNHKSHTSSAEFQSNSTFEREADYFAISFLAPKEAFNKDINNREFTAKDILEISTIYGISILSSAIRFVELTALVCSLIVADKKLNIRYEYRSKAMIDALIEISFIPLLNKTSLNKNTHAYYCINNNMMDNEQTVNLNTWYSEVPDQIEAKESIVELGYNDTFLILLNPLRDNFLESEHNMLF